MSNYCKNCKYKPELKTGETACPVTTLYWHFLIKHKDTFKQNPRTALMAKNVERFTQAEIKAIQIHANHLLTHLDHL